MQRSEPRKDKRKQILRAAIPMATELQIDRAVAALAKDDQENQAATYDGWVDRDEEDSNYPRETTGQRTTRRRARLTPPRRWRRTLNALNVLLYKNPAVAASRLARSTHVPAAVVLAELAALRAALELFAESPQSQQAVEPTLEALAGTRSALSRALAGDATRTLRSWPLRAALLVLLSEPALFARLRRCAVPGGCGLHPCRRQRHSSARPRRVLSSARRKGRPPDRPRQRRGPFFVDTSPTYRRPDRWARACCDVHKKRTQRARPH